MRPFPTLHRSTRSSVVALPAAQAWAAVASGRGDADGTSWYADAAPFVVRGALDRLVLGKGRRWPLPDHDLLRGGDRAGFWEVVEAAHLPGARRLAMTASVRAPGVVRMEVSAAEYGPESCVVTLAISFEPRGVLGRVYVVTDLPARELVIELTHRRLLAALSVRRPMPMPVPTPTPSRGRRPTSRRRKVEASGRPTGPRELCSSSAKDLTVPHTTRSVRSSSAIPSVLALVSALVVGLLAALAPGSASAAARPDFHRPSVGDCYELSLSQANAPSAPRSLQVACDSMGADDVTTQVLAVTRVPRSTDFEDRDATYSSVARPCLDALAQTVGGRDRARALTNFQIRTFVPTRRERARGARWVSCHLVLPRGGQLAERPGELTLADGEMPPRDEIRRCVQSDDAFTTCSETHVLRADGTYLVTGSYPSAQKIGRIANRKCPSRTEGPGWRFSFVGRPAYRAGSRYLVCYSRTDGPAVAERALGNG